jgi:hypothetical protein
MIQEFLANFSALWLICLGLLIFLTVFLAILSRVLKKSQSGLYQRLSRLPLQEEENR